MYGSAQVSGGGFGDSTNWLFCGRAGSECWPGVDGSAQEWQDCIFYLRGLSRGLFFAGFVRESEIIRDLGNIAGTRLFDVAFDDPNGGI